MSSASARLFGAAAALLLAWPAAADDSSAGAAPGALAAEPAGAVTLSAATLSLDGDEVRLALTVAVRGSGATMRLDLPAFGWLGEADAYPDRSFPDLRLELDGRAAAVRSGFTATANGRDVTEAVRAAGVDPFAIAATPPVIAAPPGREDAVARLVAAGAAQRAPEGLLATWTAARWLSLPVPAGTHRLTLRYTALPAFALLPQGRTPAARLANTPLDDQATRACLAQHAAAPAVARLLRGAVVATRFTVPVQPADAPPRPVAVRLPPERASVTLVCGAAPGAAPRATTRNGALRLLRLAPARLP